MQAKQKLIGIDYSFHPNFIQDDSDPKGYRLMGGGKWVVEWDFRDFSPYGAVPMQTKHYKKAFDTEQEAQAFIARLRLHVADDGAVFLDKIQDVLNS